MGSEKTYDKTISLKVSIEQFDKVHNHSSERGTDVSGLIRRFIDNLDNNKDKIIEEINFHKYKISKCEVKLKRFNKEEEFINEKEKEELKSEKVKEGEDKKQKEVNDIVKPIIDEINDKYSEYFVSSFEDVEKIEKSKEAVFLMIKSKIKGLNEELKKDVIERLIYYIERFYFKINKKNNDLLSNF